jgi:Mrp family chromosome partitioning ATPase
MQLDPPHGLTSILSGGATCDESIAAYTPGEIDVITSGPIPANPSELLGSQRMVDLVQELQDRYDVVIIDAPPVLPVADALVLAVHVEAVVLVAKVGDTTRDRLRRAKDALLKVNANLVGVVPNAVVQSEDSAYAYAYRYRTRGNPDTLELYTKQARKPELEVPAEQLEPAGGTRTASRRTSTSGNTTRRARSNGPTARQASPAPAEDELADSLDFYSSETPGK